MDRPNLIIRDGKAGADFTNPTHRQSEGAFHD